MSHRPVGSGSSFSISGSSSQSGIFPKQSDTLRVVSVGSDCHVAIGTNPTATSANYYVPSGTSATLSIGPVKSQKVVGVTTGTTTTIHFPAGTGSPFEVGDAVELTGITPVGINTNFAYVTFIDDSAGYDGYFSTRIVLQWNTSGQGALVNQNGYLREVFKVAGKTSGSSGTLYTQQVQISGNA